MRPIYRLLAAALLLPTLANADCGDGNPASLSLRTDNDVYGRADQDQGYTAGAAITWASPALASFTDDACLPGALRWINRGFGWLQPDGADGRNMVLTYTHALYTPTDGSRSDLIPGDRPYAGVMMFGLGWNGRDGDRLASTHLRLGMTGPSAQGEAAQDGVHRFFGRKRFNGWHHQLRDEVLVQLQHERLRRWRRHAYGDAMAWDLTGHAGGAFGNVASFVNAGAEIRWGRHLPDDFGTDPLRPAGENTTPGGGSGPGDAWGWHFYAGVDTRWVLQDITLDGNTWKDSHSVDKRAIVGDLSLGVAITRGRWKLAGSHVRRSREFKGQDVRPVFGTITVSRTF